MHEVYVVYMKHEKKLMCGVLLFLFIMGEWTMAKLARE